MMSIIAAGIIYQETALILLKVVLERDSAPEVCAGAG
jgi:hypothetical protein